jgi:hypothetical protein
MSKSRSVVSVARSHAMVEALEERKLMSLTVDVRLAGGGTSASPTKVGQVINLEVWATAVGANTTGTDEGLQDLVGSFVSKNVSGFAALGTLKATISAPFNGNGSGTGTAQDLDGDGDIDLGTLQPSSPSNPDQNFFARSSTITITGGTPVTNGASWKMADLTFTVTKLGGGSTSIQFVPLNVTNSSNIIAVWREDGKGISAANSKFAPSSKGTLILGSSVTLKQNIGSISGKVWNDKNSNGIREATESGAGVWQVYIDANRNGKFDTGEVSIKSLASGNYTFPKLKNGKYQLRVVPQKKWRQTFPGSGYKNVTLPVGGAITGRNFGFTYNVIIPGNVFNDVNNNGVKDAGEAGLAGWRVFADADFNGLFNKKIDTGVLTDANGNFVINTLVGGKWLIVPSVSSTAKLSSQTSPFTVVKVASGTQAKSIRFGIHQTA